MYSFERTRAVILLGFLTLFPACAWAPSTCNSVPVSGLAPVYPELWSCTYPDSPFKGFELYHWTKVDSLQPTLTWQSVPGEHRVLMRDEPRPFIPFDVRDMKDVSYDLRIWHVQDEGPEKIVYESFGIESTSHKLEVPLEPETRYYWSVRARFEIEGKHRVSEWSLINWPKLPGGGTARELARRLGEIPAQRYYRFKTPKASG